MSETLKIRRAWVKDANGNYVPLDSVGYDTYTKAQVDGMLGQLDSNKQDVITDLSDIRSGADLGRTALQRVPDGYRTADAQDEIDDGLSQRIDAIEASKFPNAVFIGEPLIVGATVGRFTSSDYMVFPFMVDVRNKPFSIEFSFHTGADVTRQQNILDSHFGMALAIQNGRGIMALSSNGSSWDIGLVTGSMAIAPNTNYYAQISWDGSAYTGSLSTDGETYIPDMYAASTAGLYPQTMYIGGAPDLFGTGSAHPFGGGVDMAHSRLIVAGLEVWHGMDDPGLASRANVSLSNLDALGKEKFKAQNLPYEDDEGETTVGEALNGIKEDLTQKLTEPANMAVGKYFRIAAIDEKGHAVLEAVDAPAPDLTDYVKNTDYATASKGGVIKSGNLYGVGVNASGEMYAASYSAALYPNKSGGMFIGKTMLNTVLANPSIQPALTAEEQLAGRQRLGMDKEWVKVGTLTTDNKDTGVSVDMTGFTEMIVKGNCVATNSVSIRIKNGYSLLNTAFNATLRFLYARYGDSKFGFDCIQFGKSENLNAPNVELTALGISFTGGLYIKDITGFIFNEPNNVTECNIEIWAR